MFNHRSIVLNISVLGVSGFLTSLAVEVSAGPAAWLSATFLDDMTEDPRSMTSLIGDPTNLLNDDTGLNNVK